VKDVDVGEKKDYILSLPSLPMESLSRTYETRKNKTRKSLVNELVGNEGSSRLFFILASRFYRNNP